MQSVYPPYALRPLKGLGSGSRRRVARTAVTALCWATLIKAGLVTGAALSATVQLIQN